MKKTLWLILLILVTSSCTTYRYSGRLAAKNSVGEDVQALAYWQRTHRPIWFDTYSGAVRLKTQCGPRTLVLSEREEGIIALWEPGLVKEDGGGEPGTVCGRVVGAKKSRTWKPGHFRLRLPVWPRWMNSPWPQPKRHSSPPRQRRIRFRYPGKKAKMRLRWQGVYSEKKGRSQGSPFY